MATVSLSGFTAVDAWLAAVLRGEDLPAEAWANAKAEALLEAADDHGVASLCYEALRAQPSWEALPIRIRQPLEAAARRGAALELVRRVELARVLEALHSRAIPFLVLKGSALAHLHYARPYLRTREDTDLLFPDRDTAREAGIELEKLGYERPVFMSGGLLTSQFPLQLMADGHQHTLDLHWRLNNRHHLGGAFSFEELARRSRPVLELGPGSRALGLADAMLMASLHRLGHLDQGTHNRLIWLYDVHVMAGECAEEDWEALSDTAAAKGLATVCHEALSTVASMLGTRVPMPILRRLEGAVEAEQLDLIAAATRWRQSMSALAAVNGWAARLRAVREEVLPPAEFMYARFGTRSRLVLPWLYVRRLARGLRKLTRRPKP